MIIFSQLALGNLYAFICYPTALLLCRVTGVGPVLADTVQEPKYNYQINPLKIMNAPTFLWRIPLYVSPK